MKCPLNRCLFQMIPEYNGNSLNFSNQCHQIALLGETLFPEASYDMSSDHAS